jgi:hypothetical protein
MSPVEICRTFVERINAHDLDGLAAQLAPDIISSIPWAR